MISNTFVSFVSLPGEGKQLRKLRIKTKQCSHSSYTITLKTFKDTNRHVTSLSIIGRTCSHYARAVTTPNILTTRLYGNVHEKDGNFS